MQNPNRGRVCYFSFALHIYCKIIVKDEDGREIIIIWHAKSVLFTFEIFESNSKEYENIHNSEINMPLVILVMYLFII